METFVAPEVTEVEVNFDTSYKGWKPDGAAGARRARKYFDTSYKGWKQDSVFTKVVCTR